MVRCKLLKETGFVYIKNIVRIIEENKSMYILYLCNCIGFIDLYRGCLSIVDIFFDVETLLEALKLAIRELRTFLLLIL